MSDKLKEFLSEFEYELDGIDSWHVLEKGSYKGDCDDHAVTVAFILSGSSWIKFWLNVCLFRMQFRRVLTKSGVTHIILKYKGKYIDNILPEFRDVHGYKPIFPWIILPPAVMIKLFMGWIFK